MSWSHLRENKHKRNRHFRAVFLVWAAICIPTFLVLGQSLRAFEKKAMEAHLEKNFAAALAYEKVLLKRDHERIDARFRGGEAALQLKAFAEAEKLFSEIPEESKQGPYTLTYFYLGIAQKRLGNYEEAIQSLQNFINAHAEKHPLFAQKAKKEINRCNWALEARSTPIDVIISRFENGVNSTSSELAPFRYADKIYFTGLYQETEEDQPVMRVFSSTSASKPRLTEINTNDPSRHTAHTAITVDGQRMFFTICENTATRGQVRCEIFYRNRNYDGTWGPPVGLPRHINLENFTSAQPTIGYDRSLKKEVLYFVSDRPGGKGSLDIWACEIERDFLDKITGFSQPSPLPFNTEEDDVTPFFHQLSQTLYFSSEGHNGMGGLDIFSVKKNIVDGQWGTVKNIGYPVNSPSDDLYYTFHSGTSQAYYSSNRPGAQCEEPEKGCFCNDIYVASYHLKLNLWVKSEGDESPLSNVRVELFDLESGEMNSFRVNPSGNFFSFPLVMERRYLVRASAEGFETTTALVSTLEMGSYAKFDRNLTLKKIVEEPEDESSFSFPADFFNESANLLIGGG